jgi:broad specificity polyphosphatase/5'/3'-nucleotidase SurE
MALSKTLDPEQKDATLDWLENNVLNHPEYGKQVKRILKKVDTRVNFPELDAEDYVETKTKEQEEKLNKFLEEQKQKENKAYWDGERKKASEAGLVSEEERGDFEKWMVEEHLGNYQKAAKLWHEEKHAAAEPTNYQDVTGIQLPNDEGLFKNPIKWGRDAAYKAINDIKRGS